MRELSLLELTLPNGGDSIEHNCDDHEHGHDHDHDVKDKRSYDFDFSNWFFA